MMLCSADLNGQFKVYNGGNVGIGVGATIPASKFCINTNGANSITSYIQNPLPVTTEYQYALVGITAPPP